MISAMALLVCVAGHPEMSDPARCRTYHLIYDGAPADCRDAALEYLGWHPWLESVRAECREQQEI